MSSRLLVLITFIHLVVQTCKISADGDAKTPWAASLDIKCEGKVKPDCEGTILTNFILVTSAGCVENCDVSRTKDTIKVKVGSDPPSKSNTARVNNIHVHDRYRLSDREVNDLALLVLDRKLKLQDGKVERVGLKKKSSFSFKSSVKSATLKFQNKEIAVMKKADCEEILKLKIGNNMMCGKSDSKSLRDGGLGVMAIGGALTDSQGKLMGLKTAQIAETALFTDVTKYVDWIYKNVTELMNKAIFIQGDPDEAANYANELLNSLRQDLNLANE